MVLIFWDANIVTVTLIWSLNERSTTSKAIKLQCKTDDR